MTEYAGYKPFKDEFERSQAERRKEMQAEISALVEKLVKENPENAVTAIVSMLVTTLRPQWEKCPITLTYPTYPLPDTPSQVWDLTLTRIL